MGKKIKPLISLTKNSLTPEQLVLSWGHEERQPGHGTQNIRVDALADVGDL
jgi:hypothetical protein